MHQWEVTDVNWATWNCLPTVPKLPCKTCGLCSRLWWIQSFSTFDGATFTMFTLFLRIEAMFWMIWMVLTTLHSLSHSSETEITGDVSWCIHGPSLTSKALQELCSILGQAELLSSCIATWSDIGSCQAEDRGYWELNPHFGDTFQTLTISNHGWGQETYVFMCFDYVFIDHCVLDCYSLAIVYSMLFT